MHPGLSVEVQSPSSQPSAQPSPRCAPTPLWQPCTLGKLGPADVWVTGQTHGCRPTDPNRRNPRGADEPVGGLRPVVSMSDAGDWEAK